MNPKTSSTSPGFIRRALRPWWARVTLLAAGIGLAWGAYRLVNPPPPPPAPPSGTAALADILQTVQAAGVLQPRVKVDVGAQVSGQVQKIHVQLGQQVKKGDLLVSLDPELARSEVAQAEAAVAQQAALIEARQADLKLTRAEVERQRRLLKGEATAATEAERAEVELTKLEADLRGQSASLKRLQAELDKRRLSLGHTSITAPMDGTVVNLPVQEGQTVIAIQITPVMVTLANMDEITVRTRVPEADIASVKVGQKARFVTLSGEAQRYEGSVRVIQPVPERAGNAVFYNVLFEVPNKERKLLSDMTVQVNIETGSAKQVLAIPVVALGARDDEGRFAVQVLEAPAKESKDAPKHKERKIRTGLQDGGRVQVLEGLKAGEKVLLAPPPPESAASAAASAAASGQ
ncbi:efflux RND transporter periplasmic adaptor subunit [Inhella gelatinilytica]|uniref:Efflux RND transporter periplasmic adaptor subunit n=1 Tax=Inhella gelatinilytica TaxID=2795030 RepID=A0A931IWD0_9BURK|nr:efflux RND transporter periplasmic adaptor subunit [Inhella gelatinilytica]MBH9554065.1 efflux RND transporter periplasmic adaptor subunit [Inhella gelatinilytica]